MLLKRHPGKPFLEHCGHLEEHTKDSRAVSRARGRCRSLAPLDAWYARQLHFYRINQDIDSEYALCSQVSSDTDG